MNSIISFLQKNIKWIKVTFIVVSSVYIIARGILPGWNEVKQDFPNYFIAAHVLAEGSGVEKLYDDDWFQSKIDSSGIITRGRFTPQPPIIAMVLLPIARFEPLTAKRIWLIFSLILIVACVLLIHQIFSLTLIDSTLIMMLMGKALSNDLFYGQLYVLITFGMLVSIWLIQVKKVSVVAGVILAVITFLKYFPILLILYCLIEKKWKVVISALLTFILIATFQIWFFGFELLQNYILEILLPHLSGNIPGQGDGFPFAFQSWTSFLNNLFVFNQYENNNPIIDWANGKTIFLILIYCVVTLVTLKHVMHIKKFIQPGNLRELILIGLLMITGIALLPASASYHMMFLVFPLAYILKWNTDIYKIAAILLVIGINFSPYPFSNNDNFFLLILSYPRLFGLMLILTLFYVRMNQVFKETKTQIVND